MLFALLAHMTLVTLAVLRRDGGQGVAASMLLANWLMCSAFVYFTGVDFPWTWYLTIDWLTAVILWMDRGTYWQRLLVLSYAIELLMHASFAWVTREFDNLTWSRTDRFLYYTQLRYITGLSIVEWCQMALVGSWIGYDAVRHYLSHRRSRSPRFARDRRAS